MTATFYVGDAVTVMNTLPEKSVDLILTSPPFLALRSYLPQDHPDKALEGGSQATPGAYIDWLLDVVEACARVLAPHGSLCFELGDTYSGSGGENHLYERPIDKPSGLGGRAGFGTLQAPPRNSNAWPLAKSLSLIPETFRWAMVYGHNPHTGRQTEPWRLRNVIRWVRPNPPVGALGDKFRPATSELMVFCKAKDRFFDLDSVRVPWVDQEQIGRTSPGYRYKPEGGYPEQPKERIRQDTQGGAPPLDWWNIPLLDGEEPTKYGPKGPQPRPEGQASGKGPKTTAKDADAGWAWERTLTNHPAGAPPLDWWNIPPGGYSGFTTWKTKVAVDPATYDGFSGDIQRTVSADCPEHGDQADTAPTESHDEREANAPIRNRGKGNHPAQGQLTDFAPTDPLPWPNLEDGSLDSPDPESIPAAIPRSKSSRKKVPVPATSPLDTPSVESPGRIGDMSESPLSDEPRPDTQGSRTSEVCPFGCSPETCDHNSDIPSAPFDGACTCSYYVEKANNTSHYAVWPPELLVKPIKAMCPEKVCRRCGEASRRIVGEAEYVRNGVTVIRNDWTSGIIEGKGAHSNKPDGQTTRVAPILGFSDCGHNDYRPGLVLDPFAGSGTTLSVATGHGRDAIGIDLDERNYELSLDRVGPLILQRGEIRDGTGPPD